MVLTAVHTVYDSAVLPQTIFSLSPHRVPPHTFIKMHMITHAHLPLSLESIDQCVADRPLLTPKP